MVGNSKIIFKMTAFDPKRTFEFVVLVSVRLLGCYSLP